MLLDRPKEEIVRELLGQAERLWGPERAEALRGCAQETAEWISLIAGRTLEMDGEEPDFLVAPAAPSEAE